MRRIQVKYGAGGRPPEVTFTPIAKESKKASNTVDEGPSNWSKNREFKSSDAKPSNACYVQCINVFHTFKQT